MSLSANHVKNDTLEDSFRLIREQSVHKYQLGCGCGVGVGVGVGGLMRNGEGKGEGVRHLKKEGRVRDPNERISLRKCRGGGRGDRVPETPHPALPPPSHHQKQSHQRNKMEK